MTTPTQILVLEASTTSAKAMVYDVSTGRSQVRTQPYASGGPDSTLHDADAVVAAVARLGRDVSEAGAVAAVALVGAWHGVLLADPDCRPITPVYLWSNTESAAICSRLRQDRSLVDWFYHATGCMVNVTYPVFTLELLKRRGQSLDDVLVLDEGSYLNWVLTGQLVQTRCLASGSGLLNIHTRAYDPDVLSWAELETARLPRLIESSEWLPLSKRGAQLLGLPEGTPVLPANSDGGLNHVGAGASTLGEMTFSVGTSGALRLAVDTPRLPREPSTWCYLSPRSWLSGAATAGACNCIDWFRDSVAGGQFGYAELESEQRVDPDGPLFQPFLFGERCPGWDDGRSGGFTGLRPHHGVRDMYRAVQEGVLFNLYQCYEALVALNGPPKRVKLSGGILHSPRWVQMSADIFNTEMETAGVPHASLTGGAVLGVELLGMGPAAAEPLLSPGRMVAPDPRVVDRYREKYDAFVSVYRREGPA